MRDPPADLADWQREAHRLEAHGKQEQLEAIRSSILRLTPTPWKPLDGPAMLELIPLALDPAGVSRKAREQLSDALAFHPDPFAALQLQEIGFRGVRSQRELAVAARHRLLEGFESKKFKGVLENTEKYGLEYRSMLSKNERAATGRTRQLFERRVHGVYTVNPALAVRVEESGGEGRWALLVELLNEPLRTRSAQMYDDWLRSAQRRR